MERGDGSGAELSQTSEGSAGQDSEGNGNQTELYSQQVNLHSLSNTITSSNMPTPTMTSHFIVCVYSSHLCSVVKQINVREFP